MMQWIAIWLWVAVCVLLGVYVVLDVVLPRRVDRPNNRGIPKM